MLQLKFQCEQWVLGVKIEDPQLEEALALLARNVIPISSYELLNPDPTIPDKARFFKVTSARFGAPWTTDEPGTNVSLSSETRFVNRQGQPVPWAGRLTGFVCHEDDDSVAKGKSGELRFSASNPAGPGARPIAEDLSTEIGGERWYLRGIHVVDDKRREGDVAHLYRSPRNDGSVIVDGIGTIPYPR